MADRVVPMDVRAAIVNWDEDAPRGAVTRFCEAAGISRSRFYEIRARAKLEGPVEAMSPRARRYRDPHPQATPLAIEELAVAVRKDLDGQGLDYGPVTVRWHLQQLGVTAPAASTLARIFTRRGMVTPQPQKRPRSSYRRFEFAMVHECWQIDAFEWPLTSPAGEPIEPPAVCVIYQVIDDRSRFMLATRVGAPGVGENSTDAIAVVDRAIAVAGQAPCLFLSDNGSAFNRTRLGQISHLVTHLKAFGTRPITGRPSHPQTQGKDERAHQTLQRWLGAHPAGSQDDLQAVVDAFDEIYNHRRPHQSLGMATPAQALKAAPVAIPPPPPEPGRPDQPNESSPVRVTQRKVAKNGNLVVRRHLIQMGLQAGGTTVTVITSGATVNVFDHRGNHLRSVVLVPGQRYYGNGNKSPGGPRRDRSSTLT